MTRTLIVGTGIAAAAYAKTKPAEHDENRTVVGLPHLWQAERMPGDHKMGQPKSLLTGNVLPNNARGQAPGKAFLPAQEFAQLTDRTLADSVNTIEPGLVTHIRRDLGSGPFKVTIKGKLKEEEFDRVILALGPGDNRLIKVGGDQIGLDTRQFAGHVMTGDEFMQPAWTPPKTMLSTRQVAIYGGSATAAWIAETAALRGLKVALWFTRPGDGQDAWDAQKRFAAAFPAGNRNIDVMKDFEGVRKVLDLTEVKLLRTDNYRFLSLDFKTQNGVENWVPDLLVYALGYEHSSKTGDGRILDVSLRDQLVPFYDKNLMISDKQSLLAIGTPDQKLMMIGSGMVSSGGIDTKKLDKAFGKYADIGSTLPPASRPPEGIAIVISSIEALNQFIPAQATGPARTFSGINSETKLPVTSQHPVDFAFDINFNTCNRTQLALYLAQTTDLFAFAANLAVELVFLFRTKVGTFGDIDADKVQQICAYCEKLVNYLQKENKVIDRLNSKTDYADIGKKRAHYHEELAAFIFEKNLFSFRK